MRNTKYVVFCDQISAQVDIELSIVSHNTKDVAGRTLFGEIVGGFDDVNQYASVHAELIALSSGDCEHIRRRLCQIVLPGDPYWCYRSFDSRHCTQ